MPLPTLSPEERDEALTKALESAVPLESAEQFIGLARYDWLVTKSWNRLHAVLEFTDEHKADMEAEWAVLSPVRLACGRTAAGVWIPGMFTRMGAQRCGGCCRATGLPEGKGSPKNDDACRVLVGLGKLSAGCVTQGPRTRPGRQEKHT
jgi:hypothetical protein